MKFLTDLLDSIVKEWFYRPKKLGLSYGLCFLGFFGPAGLHRYLDDYCTKDIDQDGIEIYEFIGLEAKRPL